MSRTVTSPRRQVSSITWRSSFPRAKQAISRGRRNPRKRNRVVFMAEGDCHLRGIKLSISFGFLCGSAQLCDLCVNQPFSRKERRDMQKPQSITSRPVRPIWLCEDLALLLLVFAQRKFSSVCLKKLSKLREPALIISK